MSDKSHYNKGELVIVRGRALSKDDNAFFIGIIINETHQTYTREFDDLWNSKQFVWEKVYKVLVQGTIHNIYYYHIKGKIN